MLHGITIRQFEEWRAYADLEPFDEERADFRAASIVQAILNVHRKKYARPLELKDCVLSFGATSRPPKRTPAQTVEEIKATMRNLMKIYNKPEQAKRPRLRG